MNDDDRFGYSPQEHALGDAVDALAAVHSEAPKLATGGPVKPGQVYTVGADEKPTPTCPACGEHVTGFESEPGHPIPNSAGYVTYLSILTKYNPCGHVFRRAAPNA